MKRANPLISPASILLTLLFLAGLSVWLWYDRGLAFSPGDLTQKSQPDVTIQDFQSHADFEKQCRLCHEPLSASLAEKCLICHTNVEQQMASTEGLHGGLNLSAGCHACHADHRGRQFDPSLAARTFFDHSTTAFSLNWHQIDYDASPLDCQACHGNFISSNVPDTACADCHLPADFERMTAHQNEAGITCQACHDGADRMRDFDHASTAYPLIGKHSEVNCAACHLDGQMQGISQTCEDCHSEPAIHAGLFASECASCHSPLGWHPAQLDGQPFDHTAMTAFSLNMHERDYSGNEMSCQSCHLSIISEAVSMQVCSDCHAQADQAFMFEHQEQFGANCLDCHDGVDRLSGFMHEQVFILDGKHAEVECQACHVDSTGAPRFQNTPAECYQCHAEPQVHAGVFGLECQTCHTSEAWSPARLTTHSFPLEHGFAEENREPDCQTCHPTTYIAYTCYSCHEHQPQDIEEEHDEEGISRLELPDCVACHLSGEVED